MVMTRTRHGLCVPLPLPAPPDAARPPCPRPKMIRDKYFIETQGYTVEHTNCYQDNKSMIVLAKNERQSASTRWKHIRHICFLLKDRVDNVDLEIKDTPTEDMWSDVLTKPQQRFVVQTYDV